MTAGKLRVRIAADVTQFVGEIHKVQRRRTLGRRPWLCRLGFHRWTFWDVRPGDFRTLESRCRRCDERRIMVYKPRTLGATENAGRFWEVLCRRKEGSGRSGK